MSIRNVSAKLKLMAEEEPVLYVVFKNKDAVTRRLKVVGKKDLASIKKEYTPLELKYGKIIAITDKDGVDLVTYQEAKPKSYKVTFYSGKDTVEQEVPVVAGDKISHIIAKAIKQLKKNKPDLRVDNVKNIEDFNGAVLFDHVRDLSKRFGG